MTPYHGKQARVTSAPVKICSVAVRIVSTDYGCARKQVPRECRLLTPCGCEYDPAPSACIYQASLPRPAHSCGEAEPEAVVATVPAVACILHVRTCPTIVRVRHATPVSASAGSFLRSGQHHAWHTWSTSTMSAGLDVGRGRD